MRVVVETNVLVSGLLSPFGAPSRIVRMIVSGALALCVDARILTEYADVLGRPKFGFHRDDIRALLDQVKVVGIVASAHPLPTALQDPADEPFLETAIAGQAECLITGNIRDFPVSARGGMKVLTPSEFLGYYRESDRTPPKRKE